MTYPLLRKEFFVETAFERRFQAMLRSAWHKRSWHVIVADPGSGKTMGIRDLVKTAGSRVILAIVTPKNNEDEQALGDQLYTALGLPLRGHWRTRKPKLMGHLHQSGTQCIIVDDAHDLSLEHLMFIKELTDQGRLQYDHPLGLCLVAAGRGNTISLKETLDLPDPTWLQFRRRLDKLNPFCPIAGHTSEEVREILAALEAETLELAASLLVLHRDTLWLIDGAGPDIDAPHSKSKGHEQAGKTEAEQISSLAPSPEPPTLPPPGQGDQARSGQAESASKSEVQKAVSEPPQSTKCMFSGMVVQIPLKRFRESGVTLVECPDCTCTRTLEPHGGALRCKSHNKRKTTTPNTEPRWAKGKADWNVLGGERNNV
jgi:hypothetical protein